MLKVLFICGGGGSGKYFESERVLSQAMHTYYTSKEKRACTT